ncbi:uncharacterized protein [Antedon mediterranea]|uniref:uncharacterized protein isoform X2 n=1 Tax=Antedon mediterranea TaxID=105859 RepID=UPI003AF75A63
MFQPAGLLGSYTPPPNGQPYTSNNVPMYDYNKNQYAANQLSQNRPPLLPNPTYQQTLYQQTTLFQVPNHQQNSRWPSLNRPMGSCNMSPQNTNSNRGSGEQQHSIRGNAQHNTNSGGVQNRDNVSQNKMQDSKNSDVFLSQEQHEEKKQLYKLFSQVLRDNGPMDVCNKRILSTFMSLPESKRKIISKFGGIQRFFLKSPMFLIQGDIVCVAEDQPDGSPVKSPIKSPVKSPESTGLQKVSDIFSAPSATKPDEHVEPSTPTKTGLDVQAQPFTPFTPQGKSTTSGIKSPNLEPTDPDCTSISLSENEKPSKDKTADDCHEVFTEKAKLLGIDVGAAASKATKKSVNRPFERSPSPPVAGSWKERKPSDPDKEHKIKRQLEASMKQKLELELTQMKLTNMEHTTEQIERKAQMKMKVKDMDLKKVNTELTEALKQITELNTKNNKLKNLNINLMESVKKLTEDKDKTSVEFQVKLKGIQARAREAEIKVLEAIYKECLGRIREVVRKKEVNFNSMFSSSDSVPVGTLWMEYIELITIQKADLKQQYDNILELLKKDIPLKDCPLLLEQNISLFVKKERKETLEVSEKLSDKTGMTKKRPMIGTSLVEKMKSPEQPSAIPSLRQPQQMPSDMFTRQQHAMPRPPGLCGSSPYIRTECIQKPPIFRPRSTTSPPGPRFSVPQNPVPIINSPPFKTMEKEPTAVNPRLAPSFGLNMKTEGYISAASRRRFQQPIPFRKKGPTNVPSIPVPSIPVLAQQMITPPLLSGIKLQINDPPAIPKLMDLNLGRGATQSPGNGSGDAQQSSFIPSLTDQGLTDLIHGVCGENIVHGQMKRQRDLNSQTGCIPKLGRNSSPLERVSGEQLDVSCMTYHVEMDETECWDDEDVPTTSPCTDSLRPCRGVGYQFENPAGGDVSLGVSDLVKTLQSWSQEVPGTFKKAHSNVKQIKSPPPPQISLEIEKTSTDSTCQFSVPSAVSIVPSTSYNDNESRRWQEIKRKKKRGQAVSNEKKPPQSSLDKIVYTLGTKLPDFHRNDYIESVRVVRESHKGTLSGVPLTEIVSQCCEYLNNHYRKTTMHDEDICAVCHEDVNADIEKLNKLECGHLFHDSCIKQWIQTRERTCPLCRTFILLPDDFPAL